MERSGSVYRLTATVAMALVLGCVGSSSSSAGSAQTAPATGPLRVLASNPRYFTDGSGKAIYLAGTQGGWEMQDDAWGGYCAPGTRVPSDFNRYLNMLTSNNLNYLRLWCVETTRWDMGPPAMVATPMAYRRTGPGNAHDGGLRFDLNQFDQAYFDRMRSRVIAARDGGIYVAVMLFEGFSCVHGVSGGYLNTGANPWFGHPFNVNNNINGINGDANGDGWGLEFHQLIVPTVTALQKAYVRKVIDTVNDLDNVLYEIANESIPESKDWQYELINTIHTYEAGKPKRHPVLMSDSWGSGGQSNSVLFQSPAEAIAPWSEPPADYANNPPAADGRKVIIADGDHIIGGVAIPPNYAWKHLLRGNNPVIFDWGLVPFDWDLGKVVTYDKTGSAIRQALGYTRTYANKMNLAAMTPQASGTTSPSSTGYCLSNAGSEYLAYQPGSGAFTVTLTAGTYTYEWFNPTAGAIAGTGTLNSPGGNISFTLPFSGDAVLYLKTSGGGGYGLGASPSLVPPGGSVAVTWTAPAGSSAQDWIGLYAAGAADTSFLSWFYTGGSNSGSKGVAMPSSTGSYEFRYFLNDGWTRTATSNRVTVGSTYTLSATPSTAAPGGSITVSWTAPAGSSALDWIGLFAVGAPSDDLHLLAWKYTGGATSGTMTFTAPSGTGNYEFRYFLNDGWTKTAASNTLSVTGAGTYSVTASPTSVALGGTATVSWTAPAGSSAQDWIGLYAVGAADTSLLSWFYTGSTTSGSKGVAMPGTAGTYEFRYFLNNGWTKAATSNRITVGSAFSLSASPTAVSPGGSLSVGWTAPSGSSALDWIGLFAVGAPSDDPHLLAWKYTGGATNGTMSFTAPGVTGSYEFRYFLNDGWTRTATSNTVTVR